MKTKINRLAIKGLKNNLTAEKALKNSKCFAEKKTAKTKKANSDNTLAKAAPLKSYNGIRTRLSTTLTTKEKTTI